MGCRLGGVAIYVYDDIAGFSDTDLAEGLRIVSPSRRAKALRYVPVLHRKLSVVAELLLRHGLREVFGIEELPEIEYAPTGKPHFRDSADLHFNLSHCDRAVVCAIGSDPVGVDVECYTAYDPEIAERVFNDAERLLIESSANPPQQFAALWTRKESLLKYTGEGLTEDLPSLLNGKLPVQFQTFHNPRGYAITVCRSCLNTEKTMLNYTTKQELYGK